jgi:hypothetical protein
LIPRLTFGSIEEDAAITILAEACSAAPEYRKELKQIIEFLCAGGVVARDGSQVKLARGVIEAQPPNIPPTTRQDEIVKETPAQKPGKTVQTQLQSTAGGVTFAVNVTVDMAEFATWRPERIQAFFRGIAEVLAAKADVEKSGGAI